MVDEKSGQQQSWPQAADQGTASAQLAIDDDVEKTSPTARRTAWEKAAHFLTWTPRWCRWDPEKPPVFSVWHNILFAFAGAFTVGNLYYNHPILNVLAADFNVPYETVSRIPTLMQAGYAAGLLFVCPLGDLLKRRPLTLGLVLFTATLW